MALKRRVVDMETKKIIWALDAFPEDESLNQHTLAVLRAVVKGLGDDVEIQPLYVLIPDEVNLLASTLDLVWTKDYEEGAKKAMSSFLKGANLPGLQEPKVLVQAGNSKSEAIQALVRQSKKLNVDLLVVSTHGRKGISRFFLGSFAETLLLESDIPVLVVNPQSREIRKVNHILFPTDFSDSCFDAFEELVSFAAAKEAKVTLFHQIPNPVEPVVGSGIYMLGGSYIPVSTYFDQEKNRKVEEGQDWVKWAEARGVAVDLMVQYQGRSIADSVIEAAEKKSVSMIAITSQRGRASAALLGSITRQVVRGAPCPVWVMHHHKNSKRDSKG
jgi:nucleotide-binding universal stress UspA family protein